jgi:ABC-type transport system involved in cytochrome bd biosynthesis fused ATPase/permease subunit
MLAADLDAWRGSVAWSAQRPALVRATVFDNIALGLGQAAPVDVRAAARAAAADSFIEELPLGYDTLVGDGARRLSAGQRQRIGLARALLRDAALTVLDEPTAHLDRVTATAIIQTLATRPRRRAMLVLTHDDQLAAIADRVVEIDVGRLGPRGARVQAHQP